MHEIILQSEEYGQEVFTYEMLQEVEEGFRKLTEECKECFAEDGIERELILVAKRVVFEGEDE